MKSNKINLDHISSDFGSISVISVSMNMMTLREKRIQWILLYEMMQVIEWSIIADDNVLSCFLLI